MLPRILPKASSQMYPTQISRESSIKRQIDKMSTRFSSKPPRSVLPDREKSVVSFFDCVDQSSIECNFLHLRRSRSSASTRVILSSSFLHSAFPYIAVQSSSVLSLTSTSFLLYIFLLFFSFSLPCFPLQPLFLLSHSLLHLKTEKSINCEERACVNNWVSNKCLFNILPNQNHVVLGSDQLVSFSPFLM
ncbi:hypothetical protein BLNAU_23778 [Blattamonas nauphoetae]|uniref:Transmembrane protein n=1 Tax=Blattamonas nauphoetae TaxID=2049346 RepID=A0ABQ9WPB3_9EUKA|nr:hypothetical protein BLNAU_23778 [Blattamonas nauphoetae]